MFRSQYAGRDAKKVLAGKEDDAYWNDIPKGSYREVEIDGETFYETGFHKSKYSDVELPALFRERKPREWTRLWDKDGNEKKEGDGPLGIAYDENGLPFPDWQVEDTRLDENGNEIVDERGRRRGYLTITGMVSEDDLKIKTKRAAPTWGKKFGTKFVQTVGFVGTLTIDEAKECLLTEDFGWKLGDDEKISGPPLLSVCYGEDHGECESLVIYTGMSEIHVEIHQDHVALHAMIQSLGYVCYNIGPRALTDKYWGEGVHTSPEPSQDDPRPDGTRAPVKYSWFYRMPPYLEGLDCVLAVEGEEGDPFNGPTALKYKKIKDKYEEEEDKLIEDRIAALKARCANEKTKPWYKELVKKYGDKLAQCDEDEEDAANAQEEEDEDSSKE